MYRQNISINTVKYYELVLLHFATVKSSYRASGRYRYNLPCSPTCAVPAGFRGNVNILKFVSAGWWWWDNSNEIISVDMADIRCLCLPSVAFL